MSKNISSKEKKSYLKKLNRILTKKTRFDVSEIMGVKVPTLGNKLTGVSDLTLKQIHVVNVLYKDLFEKPQLKKASA